MESLIFTHAEMEAITQRLKGNYKDPTGIYAARVRAKLKEIQAWHTPRLRIQLKNLLHQHRKTEVDDTPAEPTPEQSFRTFAQDIGY